MKKLLLFTVTLYLFTSCSHLWTPGSHVSTEFISMGVPDKSYCMEKCEKYGTLKYGQIDIDKPSVKVDNREYVDPWCFCMEFCLKLEKTYCEEDSTNTN